MPDEVRVVVRERIVLRRWDHDCPAEHGGRCEPEIVILEWEDGQPVEPDDSRWEVPHATPDART